MASLVPSEIGTSLNSVLGGIGEIFTNVQETVATVNSVYDQITGKSEGLPGQTTQATAPVKPAAAVTAAQPAGMPSGTMLAVGAVVFIGVLLILRK